MKKTFYIFKINGTNLYKIGITETPTANELFSYFNLSHPNGALLYCQSYSKDSENIHAKISIAFKNVGNDILEIDNTTLLNELINYRENELLSFYQEHIISSGVTMEQLKDALLRVNSLSLSKSYGSYEKGPEIIKYLEDNYVGSIDFATNTEIHNDLISNEVIDVYYDQRTLGRVLKLRFLQKLKTFDGDKKRVYLMNSIV